MAARRRSVITNHVSSVIVPWRAGSIMALACDGVRRSAMKHGSGSTMKAMVILAYLTCAFVPIAALAATETGTGSSSDSSSDSTDQICGDCIPPEHSLWFVEPEDGAVVSSPVTIGVDGGDSCLCDDCGCWPFDITEIILQSETEHLAIGPLGSFEIELAPGEYTLYAVIDHDVLGQEKSLPITITVVEGAEGGSSEGSGSSEGGGSGLTAESGLADEASAGAEASNSDTASTGCSCTSTTTTESALALGLLGLGLLASRRRSR